MGFFEEVGRQVEQFKQTAMEAAEEDAAYRCEDCEARFHVQHDRCSEWDSQSIISTATAE